MNTLLILMGIVIIAAAGAALIFYFKPKAVKVVKAGDYVMFKRRYKEQYPNIPTTHALVVENIADGKATIVFMTVKSQILREVVPLECIVMAT